MPTEETPILVLALDYKYDGLHLYYYSADFPPSFIRDLAEAVVNYVDGRYVSYRWYKTTKEAEVQRQRDGIKIEIEME